jgi:hypothetical protein
LPHIVPLTEGLDLTLCQPSAGRVPVQENIVFVAFAHKTFFDRAPIGSDHKALFEVPWRIKA